ncbi:unnamed protein product, partial [Brassica oleracea]
ATCQSDDPRSLAFPWRDDTQRSLERRPQSDTARSLAKKRPGSDLSQRRAEVAPRLFVWPNSCFLKGLLVISLCTFLFSKPMF